MTISDEQNTLVCVGVITTVHGVRGNVKVKSFTRKASDFATFGTLSDRSGKRHFNVKIIGESKGVFLVQIDGVTDRTAAESLRTHGSGRGHLRHSRTGLIMSFSHGTAPLRTRTEATSW